MQDFSLSNYQSSYNEVKAMARIQCPECDKTYAGKGGLKQHMDKHHPVDIDKKYMCEFCNRNHACTSNLKRHLMSCKSNPDRIKASESKFICEECDVPHTFKQKINLINHCFKIHNIPKPVSLRSSNACCRAMKSDRFNVVENGKLIPKPRRWTIRDTLTGGTLCDSMSKADNIIRCEIMNILHGLFSDYRSNVSVDTCIANFKLARPSQVDLIDRSVAAINKLLICELIE